MSSKLPDEWFRGTQHEYSPSWWVFWSAVVVAIRCAGTHRAIANYEERWRTAKRHKRDRWGEK